MRGIGKWLWRFMIIFSFIVNIILVIVLLVLGALIFDIKHNIAQPLVNGLHSSFVGLDESTIDWTIPVETTIPLNTSIPLNTTIPLETDTTVVLTSDVPLPVSGAIEINNTYIPITVILPQGLTLPVHLDLDVPVNLDVPVDLDVPVNMNVRAVIPVSATQLHDPIQNLRLLFEPIVRILGNLPADFGQAGSMVGQVLSGSPPNLLADTDYSLDPWPGFSQTAGLNYELANRPFPPENLPVLTGIVPTGGIPALDEGVRGDVYTAQGSPANANSQAAQNMAAQGIPPQYYDGSYAETIVTPREQAAGVPVPPVDSGTGETTTDQGIQPPPGGEPTPSPSGPSGDLGIIGP
jgi:hypothetical protein